MAGSYDHAVADDGQLLRPQDFTGMVENLGDAYETVEEMYGMIWYLADWVTRDAGGRAAEVVELARQSYLNGLSISPGTDGRTT